MTGNEQLKNHYNRVGHLVAAISLGLMPDDRNDCDELHPMGRHLDTMMTLGISSEEFADEH